MKAWFMMQQMEMGENYGNMDVVQWTCAWCELAVQGIILCRENGFILFSILIVVDVMDDLYILWSKGMDGINEIMKVVLLAVQCACCVGNK